MTLFKRRRAPFIPGFSQGEPEPRRLKRRQYGAAGTIHQTGTIDIQLKPDGTVYAAWFRCLNLPFRVSQVDEPGDLNTEAIAIESVTYVDKATREEPA